MIDLRSDTVTQPTPAMRRAMADAVVGDDVYGEDPTVSRLESHASEVFRKESGLFVPTGTMGNTIGIKLHTTHGQEVICEARSHVIDYEMAMMAWFSGCIPRPLTTTDSILRWETIREAVRPPGPHWAATGLISLENTHNMGGGVVTPPEVVDEICDHAHELGLKVHLDGARIFNAAEFLRMPVSRLCEKADTVMFCLSKGLGAPVGSVLVGSQADIARARLYRKRLGGGMRQVGVLAAAGLVALEEMPGRLGEDHRNARLLAEGLARCPGVAIDPKSVQTNIVIFDIARTGLSSQMLSAALKARGVLANGIGATWMRMVTHADVDKKDCEQAIEILSDVVKNGIAKSN